MTLFEAIAPACNFATLSCAVWIAANAAKANGLSLREACELIVAIMAQHPLLPKSKLRRIFYCYKYATRDLLTAYYNH